MCVCGEEEASRIEILPKLHISARSPVPLTVAIYLSVCIWGVKSQRNVLQSINEGQTFRFWQLKQMVYFYLSASQREEIYWEKRGKRPPIVNLNFFSLPRPSQKWAADIEYSLDISQQVYVSRLSFMYTFLFWSIHTPSSKKPSIHASKPSQLLQTLSIDLSLSLAHHKPSALETRPSLYRTSKQTPVLPITRPPPAHM